MSIKNIRDYRLEIFRELADVVEIIHFPTNRQSCIITHTFDSTRRPDLKSETTLTTKEVVAYGNSVSLLVVYGTR